MIHILRTARFILSRFYHLYRLGWFISKWKRQNTHNFTFPVNVFDSAKVSVGSETYGPLHVLNWRDKSERLVIGKYCSIASGVKFILGGNHLTSGISTFPIKRRILKMGDEAFSKGPIVIGDDVWIGTDSILLSGIEIGHGSLVAAGSVVTKSFPPFSIIGGNPARLLKKRFDNGLIETVIEDKIYSKWNNDFIKKNSAIFLKRDIEISDFENL